MAAKRFEPFSPVTAMLRLWIVSSLLFLAGAICPSSQADDELTSKVHDYAKILRPDLKQRVDQAFWEIDEKTKSPFFLVTVPSLPATGPGLIEAYAQSLMMSQMPEPMALVRSNWGHCILFLVSAENREATFHLGNKWRPTEAAALRQALNETVRPLIASGRFEEGVEQGFQAMLDASRAITTRHDGYWEIFKRAELSASIDLFLSLTAFKLSNPFLYVGIVYAIIFFLEISFPWRTNQPRKRPMLYVDIAYTLVNYILFWGLIGTALGTIASIAFDDFLYWTMGTTNLVAVQLDSLPVWLRITLLVLTTELMSYWVHRLLHGTDFFWEIHKVHHSATQLDVFNAARLHILEPITYQTLTYVPALMIGFGVGETFLVGFFTTFICNFTHANCRIRLGPLKYIINSPELHLWHHSQATQERGNCNFGNLLSMWDFIFGTGYVPEDPNVIPPMAFEGVEDYPTGYWTQFAAPFKGMYAVLTRRFR